MAENQDKTITLLLKEKEEMHDLLNETLMGYKKLMLNIENLEKNKKLFLTDEARKIIFNTLDSFLFSRVVEKFNNKYKG